MIVLKTAPRAPANVVEQVRLMALRFPGEHEVRLDVGERRLKLGPEWRLDASPACLAALAEFGDASVTLA